MFIMKRATVRPSLTARCGGRAATARSRQLSSNCGPAFQYKIDDLN